MFTYVNIFVQSSLESSRIFVWSPHAMMQAFICYVRLTGTVTCSRYIMMVRHMFPSKVPLPMGDEDPIQYMVPSTNMSPLPNKSDKD